MKTIDVCTYNGEKDILEIRLNCLKDYVDEFIIVEAPTTFSGLPKPLYFEQVKDKYKDLPIKYFVIDENYTDEEIKQAQESPNTVGADHWKHEFLQKESIKKSLTHLNNDDIVCIGDVDEILNGEILKIFKTNDVLKYRLKVYCYWLNNRSNEVFFGPIVTKYKNIKDSCLNHLRSTNHKKVNFECDGWHFTSMGGYEEVKRKLGDSYTEQSYFTQDIKDNLVYNVSNSKDFLGRNFEYKLDESEWPQYLKDNKDKYKHLCKSS
jgi:beta-1,4-mannosyl-glycoprotein beta-1,4-N-acetylglucosaminyltransferase